MSERQRRHDDRTLFLPRADVLSGRGMRRVTGAEFGLRRSRSGNELARQWDARVQGEWLGASRDSGELRCDAMEEGEDVVGAAVLWESEFTMDDG